MRVASQEFAEDPCSSMKRGAMVRAARGLLSSVTRLLILADMVDIHLLLQSLHVVSPHSVVALCHFLRLISTFRCGRCLMIRLHVVRAYTPSRQSLLFDIIRHPIQLSSRRPSSFPPPLYFHPPPSFPEIPCPLISVLYEWLK